MERSNYDSTVLFAKLILRLLFGSIFIIVATVIAVMFNFQELREICVCISNYLVWSWIAFGLSIIFALIVLYSLSTNSRNLNLNKILILIVSLLLTVGVILLILFGSRLLDVL